LYYVSTHLLIKNAKLHAKALEFPDPEHSNTHALYIHTKQMTTTVAIVDTEQPTEFKFYLGTLPDDSPRYICSNRRVRSVPAEMVTALASRVLVLDPDTLSVLGRLGDQKHPMKQFGKVIDVERMHEALEVITKDGKREIMLRACADRRFLANDTEGLAMLTHDIARLRRLPYQCLMALKAKLASVADVPAALLDAFEELPVECPEDESEEPYRVSFGSLDPVEGIHFLRTAAKLAPNRAEVRQKRKREEDELQRLSKHVVMDVLKDGRLVFTFPASTKIDHVDGTTIVTPASIAEKSVMEEEAVDGA
jgi:hypothetical protein